MTQDTTALNVCSLNATIRYCSFKYGKYHLRVYSSDITFKDEKVTSINKKVETLFAPSEEAGIISRM